MPLQIEHTKNGKPNIVYCNYKFRESCTLKSGKIIWRCLGNTCKSTITTDENKTEIMASYIKHSGHHPVTMRSLVSRPTTSTPTASPSTQRASVQATPSSPPAPITAIDHSAAHSVTSDNISRSECHLVVEISRLRSEVQSLKDMLKCILDHMIESDTRLPNHKDDNNVENTSQSETSETLTLLVPRADVSAGYD